MYYIVISVMIKTTKQVLEHVWSEGDPEPSYAHTNLYKDVLRLERENERDIKYY